MVSPLLQTPSVPWEVSCFTTYTT